MLIERTIDWGVKTFGRPGTDGKLITEFDPFQKFPELLEKSDKEKPSSALLLTARGYYFKKESYPEIARDLIPDHLETRRQTFEDIPHLGIFEIADELANNGVRSDIGDLYDLDTIEKAKDGTYDLVMISMMDIAKEWVMEVVLPKLERLVDGGQVVLGGYGAEGLEDIIHEKFPNVVIIKGFASGEVKQYLDDHEQGTEKNTYERGIPQNVHNLNDPYYKTEIRPYREHPNLKKSKFQPLYLGTGCTEECPWCKTGEVSPSFKPLKVVEKEISQLTMGLDKWMFFLDQNLFAYPTNYVIDVFQMINDMGHRWIGEGTIGRVVNNQKLMETLAIGCWGLLAGTEDLYNSKPGASIKDILTANIGPISSYLRQLKIPMSYSIVFGLDNQDKTIFKKTADRVNELGINALVHIATPRAGTIWEAQLKQEDRLRGSYFQRNQKFDVTFEPKNMSQENLLGGFALVHDQVFAQKQIDKRLNQNLYTGVTHGLLGIMLYLAGQKMQHGSRIDAGLKYFLATALMERDGKDTKEVLSVMYSKELNEARSF